MLEHQEISNNLSLKIRFIHQKSLSYYLKHHWETKEEAFKQFYKRIKEATEYYSQIR